MRRPIVMAPPKTTVAIVAMTAIHSILDGRVDAEALEDHDQRQPGAQRHRGGERDAAGRGHQPLIARAMTTRWISLVPS
jgi:hypothetical protein